MEFKICKRFIESILKKRVKVKVKIYVLIFFPFFICKFFLTDYLEENHIVFSVKHDTHSKFERGGFYNAHSKQFQTTIVKYHGQLRDEDYVFINCDFKLNELNLRKIYERN